MIVGGVGALVLQWVGEGFVQWVGFWVGFFLCQIFEWWLGDS